jgi:hypothetical protein
MLTARRTLLPIVPCQTDLYFSIGDIEYESQFIPNVKVVAAISGGARDMTSRFVL